METPEKFIPYFYHAWQHLRDGALHMFYFIGFLGVGIVVSALAYISVPLWPLIAGFWIANRWWYPGEKKKPSPPLP